MKYITLYLHVHQPHRLKNLTIFDIGNNVNYFEDHELGINSNREVFNKITEKSYLPMNTLLLKMLNKYPNFKLNLSITGTFIEQANFFNKKVLNSFKKLANTKKVEILSETYYHSLASLYSPKEFKRQVSLHNKAIKKHFNLQPKYFRNTELIYSDRIARYVEDMGFKGIITEGTEKILQWRSPNYLYKTQSPKGINLMLKNYKLSDDIAWRFSNKSWVEHPLTSHKYIHWLDNAPGEVINLFMDYETFGEHQWEDTGIFDFMENFIEESLQEGYKFINFKEVDNKLNQKDKVSSPFVISWADEERDTTAWTENSMQQDSLKKIYEMEDYILDSENEKLINLWRYLQISDHFYYMCTKWFNDGDAHAYFSPYKSPYDAYNIYNNAIVDLKQRLSQIKNSAKIKV